MWSIRRVENDVDIASGGMTSLVSTLNRKLTGSYDALDVFRALTSVRSSGPKALLETACIHSREHTQSLLMLSAAIKIVCRDFTVSIHALNANGESALNILSERMPFFSLEGASLVRKYNTVADIPEQEEQKKLLDISVIEPLRQILQIMKVDQLEDDSTTLLIGCFSFELFHQFEHIESLGKDREFPDYEFYIADQLLIIDHQQCSAKAIAKVFKGNTENSIRYEYQRQLSLDHSFLAETTVDKHAISKINTPTSKKLIYTTNLNDEQYIEKVHALKKHVVAGDIFQAVLARQFSLDCCDALLAYQILREQNPSPYMFYIDGTEYQLLGASPESAVKVTANDNSVSIYPIAGTRSRGLSDGSIDHDLDSRMEAELRMDAKETAEHMMLVDLARNDIARISKRATRRLKRLMDVDRYSHVMHLVSKVTGELKDEMDCFTAYRACMNMGTLSGAPKVRATQLIAQYESLERGPYGGAVGYINACGDMDTAIVIRSAVVKEGTATVSAGAGIVFDSDPQSEADETRNKAMAVLRAIDTANQLSMTDDMLSVAGGRLMNSLQMNASEVETSASFRVLLIDNFDSFIYNLAEEFYRMGAEVQVVRNDISESTLNSFIRNSDLVVLSPGPGKPEEAGICISLVQQYRGVLPIMGVCLGHQAIIHAYGGKVARAKFPVHGKVSEIKHNNHYCFAGLTNPLSIGRYHSLVATDIPVPLISIAESNGLSMCVIDPEAAVLGFQFHPESILTSQGSVLLKHSTTYLIALFKQKRTQKKLNPQLSILNSQASGN